MEARHPGELINVVGDKDRVMRQGGTGYQRVRVQRVNHSGSGGKCVIPGYANSSFDISQ
jgi:hypothetical protein